MSQTPTSADLPPAISGLQTTETLGAEEAVGALIDLASRMGASDLFIFTEEKGTTVGVRHLGILRRLSHPMIAVTATRSSSVNRGATAISVCSTSGLYVCSISTPVGSPCASRSISMDGAGGRVSRPMPATASARLLAIETIGSVLRQ